MVAIMNVKISKKNYNKPYLALFNAMIKNAIKQKDYSFFKSDDYIDFYQYYTNNDVKKKIENLFNERRTKILGGKQ